MVAVYSAHFLLQVVVANVGIIDQYEESDGEEYVLPQAFGGGRPSRSSDGCRDSIMLDYKLDRLGSRRRNSSPTLFSVDCHPNDGHSFIVGSAFGDVRLFDLRKIVERNPSKSYVNIYRNWESAYYEITGCVFNKSGTEIVATALNNYIYVFDVNTNYEKLYDLDYFSDPSDRKNRKRKNNTESSTEKTKKKSKITERPEKEGENGEKAEVKIEDESDTMEVEKSDEWEGDEEMDDKQSPTTYKNIYKGHYSSSTIKAVNFYGPNSEFVITGSDDARIFIWDKDTAQLLTTLEGHHSIVNCIVGHPTQPMIASSGIDDVVKLWQNIGDYPDPETLAKKKRHLDTVSDENMKSYVHQGAQVAFETFCSQQ